MKKIINSSNLFFLFFICSFFPHIVFAGMINFDIDPLIGNFFLFILCVFCLLLVGIISLFKSNLRKKGKLALVPYVSYLSYLFLFLAIFSIILLAIVFKNDDFLIGILSLSSIILIFNLFFLILSSLTFWVLKYCLKVRKTSLPELENKLKKIIIYLGITFVVFLLYVLCVCFIQYSFY